MSAQNPILDPNNQITVANILGALRETLAGLPLGVVLSGEVGVKVTVIQGDAGGGGGGGGGGGNVTIATPAGIVPVQAYADALPRLLDFWIDAGSAPLDLSNGGIVDYDFTHSNIAQPFVTAFGGIDLSGNSLSQATVDALLAYINGGNGNIQSINISGSNMSPPTMDLMKVDGNVFGPNTVAGTHNGKPFWGDLAGNNISYDGSKWTNTSGGLAQPGNEPLPTLATWISAPVTFGAQIVEDLVTLGDTVICEIAKGDGTHYTTVFNP